ncbi:UNVERIFIED_CONTAM: hypothetical protein BJ099_1074 [Lysinibacillus xylanilyticus]|uniref:hypothetical protein n=1 Tax=Lysinibacillus xylanilyticus TaxID=582475 RepID=UPI0006716FC9|nr:hypothetical protein [Lysinibacillus xylanilyticus]
MAEVLIVPYDSEYKEDLKRLSYEWLEKYVSVEPEDERIINNPEEVVLNCGGFIFFAKYKNEIVGTVSLIKLDGQMYRGSKVRRCKQNYTLYKP